jgi:hypothetical protein
MNLEHLLSVYMMTYVNSQGVLKPSNGANPNEDQKQLEEALRTLAQDRKNEIWMVTSQGVGAAEYAYSHINPNLNFAGRYRNQIQLSKYNTKSVKLPHVASLLEIENIAKQRITTCMSAAFKLIN